MPQQIVLNILFLFFAIIVLIEDSLKSKKISINQARIFINTLSIKQLFPFFLIPLGISILLLIQGVKNVVSIYIYAMLSILLYLHAIWLSQKLNGKYNKVLYFLFIFILLLRVYYPTVIIHDIFIALVVAWLGPFITSFRFFTHKLFVVISILWFFYDIFYIWVSKSYEIVTNASSSSGFPLGLIFDTASIGSADLLFASLLISILKNKKNKILVIMLLIDSNLTLSYYVYNIQFIPIFPLLVLWVPCGLLVLIMEKLLFKKSSYSLL